jgi:streptomycin 6-kinase
MMAFVPDSFAKFIIEIWEQEGAAWLARLPELVADFERRWSFTAEPPFPDLSYNYVAPVKTAAGGEAVLKLGVPRDELRTEIEALRLYDGRGIARLLAAASEEGAMLLERLRPGEMLSSLAEKDDEAATIVAAELMKQLWRPVPEGHSFPTIADWGRGLERLRAEFEGGTGPFPRRLVEAAEGYYRELSASMETPVLLHGDFHHWNVITAEREPWLAIDPKGLVGEPAYEICPLLYNPIGVLLKWSNPAKITARRIAILSERLEIDKERIIGWGIYQCVLSAWWSYEDQGYGWDDAIEIARILQEIGRGNL